MPGTDPIPQGTREGRLERALRAMLAAWDEHGAPPSLRFREVRRLCLMAEEALGDA